LRGRRVVAVLSSELDHLYRSIERWFERYTEMGDVSAYFMFKDDIEVAENYAELLLKSGKIHSEEFFRFLNYCDEKLESLKSILGLSDEDVVERFA